MEKQLEEYFKEFPVPSVLNELHCMVCLDNFDFESNKKFIKLPCDCANSVYHIDCLIQWILSGPNKNHCVHCGVKYLIPDLSPSQTQNQNPSAITRRQNEIIQRINDSKKEIKLNYAMYKLSSHIFLNTVLNIINFSYIFSQRANLELKILALAHLLKLFSNFIAISVVKRNFGYINTKLFISFAFQFMIMVYVILLNNKSSLFLLLSQIGFVLLDLIVTVIINYNCEVKVQNVIYDLGVISRN